MAGGRRLPVALRNRGRYRPKEGLDTGHQAGVPSRPGADRRAGRSAHFRASHVAGARRGRRDPTRSLAVPP
eukprot:16442206-Heterocapsa_arctica.AAC.1